MIRSLLQERLHYNDGLLTWATSGKKRVKGAAAGSVRPDGRYQICIDRKVYLRSRVIWTLLNGDIPGDLDIDHINRDKADDRIENLRLVTRSQNLRNVSVRSHACSGYKGVSPYNRSGKYRARIWDLELKQDVLIGIYDSKEEAYKAYCDKAAEYAEYLAV